MELVHFDCQCTSIEHSIRITVDEDMMYVETQMSTYLPFYRRILTGFKYIFGFEGSNPSHWDVCILGVEDVSKLRTMCNEVTSFK